MRYGGDFMRFFCRSPELINHWGFETALCIHWNDKIDQHQVMPPLFSLPGVLLQALKALESSPAENNIRFYHRIIEQMLMKNVIGIGHPICQSHASLWLCLLLPVKDMDDLI